MLLGGPCGGGQRRHEEEDGAARGGQEALLGHSSLTFPCLRALGFRVGQHNYKVPRHWDTPGISGLGAPASGVWEQEGGGRAGPFPPCPVLSCRHLPHSLRYLISRTADAILFCSGLSPLPWPIVSRH